MRALPVVLVLVGIVLLSVGHGVVRRYRCGEKRLADRLSSLEYSPQSRTALGWGLFVLGIVLIVLGLVLGLIDAGTL